MKSRIQHLHRDQKGMTLVFVGASFMAFMATSTLAIDVGMFMTARTQAQNSADSGALAGAVALAFNSNTDRSASGPAVQSAINASRANNVIATQVSVNPSDVTFVNDSFGQPNAVRVNVYRTTARGNPVSTLLGGIFGVTTANVEATATAEATRANAARCVAPFAIPDRWTERQTSPWDPTDTYNAFPANPSVLPDVYRAANLGTYSGYNSQSNRGLQLTLHEASGTDITAGAYFPIQLPGSAGAADLQWNVSHCDDATMHFFDSMSKEPGSQATTIRQGVQDLIALDPAAYWDTATNRVVSTQNPSPRVKIVPLVDPHYWNLGKLDGNYEQLKAANYIGFFIESISGNDIVGRITPVTAVIDPSAPQAPVGSFARVIRLIQ